MRWGRLNIWDEFKKSSRLDGLNTWGETKNTGAIPTTAYYCVLKSDRKPIEENVKYTVLRTNHVLSPDSSSILLVALHQ